MRARNIKPGFYKNENLVECSIPARLLAPGLWMLADREGRLLDKPKQIKMEIFPCDDVNVDALLAELHLHGHILRYEKDGLKCIQILGFNEHQSPHFTEKASLIPAEEGCNFRKKSSSRQTITKALPPDSLNPDSLIQSPNGDSVPTRPPASKKQQVALEELSVDHITEWLTEKRMHGEYLSHNPLRVLEIFKDYCRSNGKKYKDFVAAYRNAFDWERCRPSPQTTQKTKGSGAIIV